MRRPRGEGPPPRSSDCLSRSAGGRCLDGQRVLPRRRGRAVRCDGQLRRRHRRELPGPDLSRGIHPAHTYAAPGTYTITVSLTGAYGGTGTATTTLTVATGGGLGTGVAPPMEVASITTTFAKGAITAFNVDFDGFVGNAADSSNYALLLVKSRKVKKKLVTTTKRIAIKSVSFDASEDIARIVPAGRLAPGKVNELTINTAGLTDSQGEPVGGELIADIRGKVVTIR